MLIASILVLILLPVMPLRGLLIVTVAFALFVFVLASWLMMREHDRRLCERCLLSTPLNPSEHAARYGRRFWMAHTGLQPRFLVPYLVVLIGSNFATPMIGRIGWAVIQSSMIYLVLSYSTHRKYQPWCPWCRRGGDGEQVEGPSPILPDDRQPVY
jgi:hypothetical protein